MIGAHIARGHRIMWAGLAVCTVAGIPAAAQRPPGGPPVAAGITVLHLNDLSLGTVIAGMTASVQPTEANAARYSVEAQPNATVKVRFTLPATLQSAGSTLPVTFGANSGAWSTRNDPATATRFDPVEGFDVRMPVSRIIHVWIGAQVAAPGQQPAGGYAGTLTMTVSYN